MSRGGLIQAVVERKETEVAEVRHGVFYLEGTTSREDLRQSERKTMESVLDETHADEEKSAIMKNSARPRTASEGQNLRTYPQ